MNFFSWYLTCFEWVTHEVMRDLRLSFCMSRYKRQMKSTVRGKLPTNENVAYYSTEIPSITPSHTGKSGGVEHG
jgi:hypothetical protein